MNFLLQLKYLLASFLMVHGRDRFIRSLPSHARVLDVGCGNNSPERVKIQRPDVHYVGLDIGTYNQTVCSLLCADEYITADRGDFSGQIMNRPRQFDAVISSHNLEHCDHPWEVLDAMLGSLKTGGRIYLSFPSEGSIAFPSRKGTLNFSDDPTHLFLPPFDKIIARMTARGFSVFVAKRRYHPPLLLLLGLLLEPIGALTKRNMPFGATWALYGFESLIWATKK